MQQMDYSNPAGQCRLLLVSLLDNFCSMYDRNPGRNQKLFSLLCRKLSSMGILKSLDFMEESRAIRSVYKDAFREIVLDAVRRMEESTAATAIHLNTPLYTTTPVVASDSNDSFATAPLLTPTGTSPSRSTTRRASFTHFLGSSDSILPPSALGEEFFLSGRSRYKEDFVEGRVLGRGGYGKVVIADNKLDGTRYAVKKIHFSGVSSTRFTRILREVKSLARLDHFNIVRYNSAWIEDHSVILAKINENGAVDGGRVEGHRATGDHDDEDQFADSHGSHVRGDESDIETAPIGPSWDLIRSPRMAGGKSDGMASPVRSGSRTGRRFQLQDRKVMYIQMELCRFTLDHYIKLRNAFYFECLAERRALGVIPSSKQLTLCDRTDQSISIPAARLFTWGAGAGTDTYTDTSPDTDASSDKSPDTDPITLGLNPAEIDRIFKGIVKGLHYIHEHGMIHRDLKPMNIFFQGDELTPKIGDFGLVSEITSSCGVDCITRSSSVSPTTSAESGLESDASVSTVHDGIWSGTEMHTRGVGTATYASPEQLLQEDYSLKSDIYSLGIICFELFYPVATQMERMRVLDELKNHHRFPEAFLRQWPKEAAFIWSCIAGDPTLRPSTREILESEWLDRDLDETVSRLESENEMLRGLLRAKEEESRTLLLRSSLYVDEIERLRRQVQALECK